MKKFLIVLVVLLLISVALPVVSSADGFDFSSMSLEELLGLRNAVDEEIRARVSTPSAALYNGTYVIGKDIRPGRYLLTVFNHMKVDRIDYAAFLLTTPDGKETEIGLIEGMSTVIDLDNGAVLEVLGVLSATLTEVPQASYAP